MDGLSALLIIIIVTLFIGLLLGSIVSIIIPRPPTIIYMPVHEPPFRRKASCFVLITIVAALVVFVSFLFMAF